MSDASDATTAKRGPTPDDGLKVAKSGPVLAADGTPLRMHPGACADASHWTKLPGHEPLTVGSVYAPTGPAKGPHEVRRAFRITGIFQRPFGYPHRFQYKASIIP